MLSVARVTPHDRGQARHHHSLMQPQVLDIVGRTWLVWDRTHHIR